MLTLLLFAIIGALLLLRLRMFANVCQHIKATYPAQWANETAGQALAGEEEQIARAKIRESIKRGYFATCPDPKITAFKRLQTFTLAAVGLIVVAQLVLAGTGLLPVNYELAQ